MSHPTKRAIRFRDELLTSFGVASFPCLDEFRYVIPHELSTSVRATACGVSIVTGFEAGSLPMRMVNPETLRALFDEAVGLPTPDRAAFLQRTCRDDAVRGEVERLLVAHDQHASVFDTMQASDVADSPPFPAARRMSLAAGEHLGPYAITAFLGAGGMGEVYMARDTRLDRAVALKVLSPELTDDTTARQRFEREARAVAGLSHPHICPLFDIGHQNGTVFLVMEYLGGETLASRLSRGKLTVNDALTYANQIADALGAAHRAGIVHRDLKPGNVMLTAGGAKLLDFGLAKHQHAPLVDDVTGLQPEPLTRTGMILGTVQYMAPEQLEGREADERTDIFAFAVVLYEMLTGRRAFEGTSDAALIGNILHTDPPAPATIERLTPPALDALVRVCLAKDPSARCQSMTEVQARLSVAQEGLATPRATRIKVSPLTWSAAFGLLSVLGGLAWWGSARYASTTATSAPPMSATIQSSSAPSSPLIAVLPFRNLTPEPTRDYFAAGMTEEIRGQLSTIGALRLLSRAGVERYGENDASRAAGELGATHFVTGTVRFAGDRVRIAIELTDTGSRQTLWYEQYERGLADSFALQSEIAMRVARALSLNLSPQERARLARRPTQNPEAYQLYLRESAGLAMGNRDQNLLGIELLKRALVLDPKFAVAEARLAYRTVMLSSYDNATYLDEAVSLARHSIELDPLMSAGHVALASAYARQGLYGQARLSYLRALELDPNDLTSMANFSILEVQTGRIDEALYWARRGFQLSARGSNDYYHLAVPILYLRNDALTSGFLAEAQRRFPSATWPHVLRSFLEVIEKNDFVGALAQIRRVAKDHPNDEGVKRALLELAFVANSSDAAALAATWSNTAPEAEGWLLPETPRLVHAFLLARADDSGLASRLIAEAESVAQQAVAAGRDSPLVLIELGAVSALKGDSTRALEWLTRAYAAGHREYGLLARDPFFASVRTDPRFRRLLEQMATDVAAMRRRAVERNLLDLAVVKPIAFRGEGDGVAMSVSCSDRGSSDGLSPGSS